MTDATTFNGNCHCGANRFTLSAPALGDVTACSCSLCFKKGYLWLPATADQITFTRGGPQSRTTYRSSLAEHTFCAECGTGLVGSHHAGPLENRLLVNVGSFMDTDPFALKIVESDGRAHEAPMQPQAHFEGDLPTVDDGQKMYLGSCQCGAVRLALASKPVSEVEIKQCNCSICVRTGAVQAYPDRDQVTILGREHTKDYSFGRKFGGFPFCKTCGVSSFGNLYGPPQAVVDRLPEAKKAFVASQLRIQPVNLRVFADIEWDKITVKRENEGTDGYILAD